MVKQIKKITFVAVILFAAFPGFAQESDAREIFNTVSRNVKKMQYCHVSIHYNKYFDWSTHPSFEGEESVISVNNSALKKTTIIQTSIDEDIVINGKEMVVLDMDRKLYMRFRQSRDESSEYVSWEDKLNLNTINMISCYAPWMKSFRGGIINKPNLVTLSDTSISGIQHKIIRGKQTFPHNYNLTYYYNEASGIIEKLVKELTDSNAVRYGVPTKIELIISLSTTDRTDEMAKKYNQDNDIFKDFEFSDDSGMDFCKTPPAIGEMLSKELLDFPLQCLDGSTSTLRDMEGYLLLDFFNNYCGPCFRFMKEQKDEVDSMGVTRLAEQGITTISLNPRSRNIELTREKVYDFTDIQHVFLCYGMEKHLMLRLYPTFMLISPDKRVLLVTYLSEENYIEKIIETTNCSKNGKNDMGSSIN